MDLIVSFSKNGMLPKDRTEVEKIRRKAPRYWLSEEQKLYKRSFSSSYLLCVHPKAVEALLEELHEGVCGSYTMGRSLSHRALMGARHCGTIPKGHWKLKITPCRD